MSALSRILRAIDDSTFLSVGGLTVILVASIGAAFYALDARQAERREAFVEQCIRDGETRTQCMMQSRLVFR